MLAGGFLALRTIGRFWIRLFVGYRQSRRQKRPSIEFYDRLEKLLAQHGMQRMPEQTPRKNLPPSPPGNSRRRAAQPAVATIPSDTVDLFYRVRSGGHRLDTDDQERLENAFQLDQGVLDKHFAIPSSPWKHDLRTARRRSVWLRSQDTWYYAASSPRDQIDILRRFHNQEI